MANMTSEHLAELAEEINLTIDWEILCTLDPTRKNWIRIKFASQTKSIDRGAIDTWCQQTFVGGYYIIRDHIYISREEDVVMFKLKWA